MRAASRGKVRLAVDDADQREQDRREEDEEAPEDERVHEAGDEALEELPLAEDDRRLVLDALGTSSRRSTGFPGRTRRTRSRRAPDEQRDADGRDRRQGERGEPGRYAALASRSSAEIAGTTSCRSPITA